ncbi:CbtA family protein [uncultured Ferrovibrio sp.]|uniref:CbtA family protein n=1 Tax=uncultured Ferrovibrio sp. TaxID=1576913 RepID=UPI00262994AB|nr:CbtA family protein [uncultured Ferrovibrio sp.]
MALFRRIFWVAALAGLLAGLLTTAVHHVSTVPLILQAEIFEAAGASPHDHGHSHGAHDHGAAGSSDDGHADHHHHDDDAWAPEDGLERFGYTALAHVLTGIGFALLLVCAYVVSGREVGWRQGLLWGLAGFAVFTLAPGLGLRPELPGTETAPLEARQIWWLATALATGAGLALIVFGRRPLLALAGVLLLVLPHLYGAPLPETHHSAAPETMAQLFAQQAFAANLLFWAGLGALTGFFYQRFR